MINTTLIFYIVGLSAISWLWIYSTPTILLREKLKQYKPFKYPLITQLIECLTCSTFWITYFSLVFVGHYGIVVSLLSAGIASLLITILDGNIKTKL